MNSPVSAVAIKWHEGKSYHFLSQEYNDKFNLKIICRL